MRRGLIAWSRDEVPASALDARVARLQAAMREEGLDALLVYSSFPRPAAVAWLTHFVPYWNDALLAVFPDGAPVLLAAFSKRVHPWIREVSHVGEVRAAPELGEAAAKLLDEKAAARAGVVELDALPWRIAAPIARRALAAAPEGARLASHALAAAEKSARNDGAEDVIARLAPDLREDATLLRMEGDAPLGVRWALELTLAYKGTTVRVTRSYAAGAMPASWQDAEGWFARTAAVGDQEDAPGRIVSWRVDASIGTAPLETVEPGRLPKGALAVESAQLALADGPWLAAGPVLLWDRALD